MRRTIKYVGEESMDSSFGRCVPDFRIERIYIYILDTLPKDAKVFTLAHETFHADNYSKKMNRFLEEIQANIAGFKASPKGFFQVFWMSVSSIKRWGLYIRRIRDGF